MQHLAELPSTSTALDCFGNKQVAGIKATRQYPSCCRPAPTGFIPDICIVLFPIGPLHVIKACAQGGKHHYPHFSGKGTQCFARTMKIAFPAAERQASSPRLLLPLTSPSGCRFGLFLLVLLATDLGSRSFCMALPSHLKPVLSLFNSLSFRLDNPYFSCSIQNVMRRSNAAITFAGVCCYYFCCSSLV